MVATSITFVLAACSDDGGKDASVDIDNGSCGDQLRFTGATGLYTGVFTGKATSARSTNRTKMR